ncbi:hypothetical protein [Trueperella pecoris]|uniref:hypothetical protein n=1 Tax=Trueperella pecoris TaxID=2733571 RepID=UPI001ABE01A9|nr:hypothetical protein [Trueperella pecoris]QTG76331.1 hypothetical protein J4179_04690 [Trueperella pecoris]
MKRVAVPLAVLLLAGCGASDAIWSVPLSLGSLYQQVSVLSIAETDDLVVVPVGQTLHGFAPSSGKEAWTLTLADDVTSCEPIGANVLCQLATRASVVVDKAGTSEARSGLVLEGRMGDKLYFSRAGSEGVELIEEDASASLTQVGTSDVVLARFDGRSSYLVDGTRVESVAGNYPEPLARLLDGGVIQLNSPWLNPPGIARVAQPLKDGFVVVEPGQPAPNARPTKVSVFDGAGDQTAQVDVTPMLHLTINPQWTRQNMTEILERARRIETGHAFVFPSGQVEGFDEILTDSVAPSFANVKGVRTAAGKSLDITPVRPESVAFFVGDYPFVSVRGKSQDGVVATTFNLASGKKVSEDVTCQWSAAGAYCFGPDKLEKIAFDD